MINPIQLCDVAKLHQRDVKKEIASRQIANQAKNAAIARPGSKKRFIMLSFSSNRGGNTANAVEALSR
jgi:hypothetical protein